MSNNSNEGLRGTPVEAEHKTEKRSRREFLKLIGAGMLGAGGVGAGIYMNKNPLTLRMLSGLGLFLKREFHGRSAQINEGLHNFLFSFDEWFYSKFEYNYKQPFQHSPNIVLISIDTLRRDAKNEVLMPLFCDWIKINNCLEFTNAHANSTWTLPSHTTIFTGLLPREHLAETRNSRISDESETFTERLRSIGYRTVAFAGGGFVGEQFGFSKGFDFWQQKYGEEDSFTKAKAYVSTYQCSKHLFLFLHTYYVHDYYAYPEKDYGKHVKFVDSKLVEFLDAVLRSSISDNLRMIITSDHGEGFGEAYDLYGGRIISSGHCGSPCPSEVEIPLIIYDSSGLLEGLSDHLVGLDNIRPTIEAWAGIRDSYEGSLLGERESLLSEAVVKTTGQTRERRVAIISGDGEYIDTYSEPMEDKPLGKGRISYLPEEVKKDLRALGYLR